MLSIPNAIGAICLNQAGLDHTVENAQVLTNFINTAVDGSMPEGSERENTQQLGAALDELARHHPTLRPIILKAVVDLLQKATESGKAFTPSAEEANDYSLKALAETPKKPEDVKTSTNVPLATLTKVFKVCNSSLFLTPLTGISSCSRGYAETVHCAKS